MTTLEAKHLVKAFGNLKAVDDASFAVSEGSIFGLLGRNGAGKTTCIRMIMDIYPPDSGKVTFGGIASGSELNRQVGYLPEERGLYKTMKVLNTLKFFAAIKGKTGPSVTRAAEQYLERFDLTDRINTKVEDLSKGNQQKVQFIASVLHDPKILILDELFSGLDPVNTRLLKDIILEKKAEGKVILFSTHVLEFAEQMCDHLAIIDNGIVKLNGSVDDIKAEHGKHSVSLNATGDLSFLSQHQSIDEVTTGTNNRTIVKLRKSTDPQELLKLLVDKGVTVRNFNTEDISIEEVFMRVVGKEVPHV